MSVLLWILLIVYLLGFLLIFFGLGHFAIIPDLDYYPKLQEEQNRAIITLILLCLFWPLILPFVLIEISLIETYFFVIELFKKWRKTR